MKFKTKIKKWNKIFLVFIIFFILGILVSSSSGEDNVSVDNIDDNINDSISNITLDLNSDLDINFESNESIINYTNDTLEINLTKSNFDIEIILNTYNKNDSNISDDEYNSINLLDEIKFNVNLTLYGIEIYSIRANVSVITPENKSYLINKTENLSFNYNYLPLEIGEYYILVEALFQNQSYYENKSFIVINETLNNTTSEIDYSNNKIVNNTEIKKSLENKSLENITIINKPKGEGVNKDGFNFEFNFADDYFYEYGPILIIGNASAYNSNKKVDVPVSIEIYPENNKNKTSFCSFDVNGSREFFCELNRNLLEITKYVVKVNTTYLGKEYEYYDNFNLKLKEIPDISLDLDFDDKVKTSELQQITVNATRGNKVLENADVSIQIIDPDNVVYSIVSKEIEPGIYQGDFYGLELGKHTIKVTYAKSSEFKTSKAEFEIVPLNVTMELNIPELIYHNSGSLNIKGNLSLMLDNISINNDVSLSIYGEDSLKKTCLVYCEGYCNFSCPISNYIEFTKYRIYATMQYDFLDYSVYKEFDVKFKEIDLGLDIEHKENYSLGEPQSYIIDAYDKSTEKNIDGATIFVEITDPDENVYRILPSPTESGKYSFDFISVIPGYYNLSLTFVKGAIYSKKDFMIYVSKEEYIEPIFEEKNISLVQLPAEVGKNVKWIREVYVDEHNKNSKLVLSKYAENLKINNLIDNNLILYVDDDITNKDIANKDIANNNVSENITNKNNNLITYEELKKWNELNDAKINYKKLLIKKEDSTFIEKVAISNKIEQLLSQIKKLELVQEINLTKDPYLSLTNLSGYNVITYETPAPQKIEKNISEFKKEVTIYSDIHYKNVLARTNITEVNKDQIEVYWIQESELNNKLVRNKILFEDVEYIDKNKNGLIDEIQWVVPHLSNQTFEVIITIENKTFKTNELESVQQYDLAKFIVKPNWPKITNKESFFCTLVLNNISYDMDYDNGQYEYYYEFTQPGKVNYKILCDSQVQESNLEVYSTEDIFRKRTKFSKTYYVNDLMYLTESSMKPKHYDDKGIWKNIDTDFVSKENEYSINRGLYAVDLQKNTSLNNILNIKKDGFEINTKPISIVYYDESSNSEAVLMNINSPNEITISKTKNSIKYHNYFDFIDVVYEYNNENIKQNLILYPEAIKGLPNPATFGMNEKTTYVMLVTDVQTLGFTLPEIKTTEIIELANGEYYLDRDYYYSELNPDIKNIMSRRISQNSIISGLLYSEIKSYENETLILDPSFNILATNRDAMSIDNTTKIDYYDANSQYLFFGENNGEIYQSGIQFQLDVPNNATIVSAYLTFTPGLNASNGTFTTNISVEDVDNSLVYSNSLGDIKSHATYYTDKIAWDVGNWSLDYNYTSPDISLLVEHIVNRTNWQKGNYIAFMVDEGNASNNYRSFHDYSSPSSSPVTLTVIYQSEESRPIIDLTIPNNGTITNNNTILFNFTPYDTEGLDVCELYGNFTGVFEKNQTLYDPINATNNNFSTINLNDGSYIWNVWCNDTMGNYNFNLTDFEFIVDTLPPEITLVSPNNNDTLSDFDINFEFNVLDDLSPNSTCSLLIDGITNISGIISNNSQSHVEVISNISSGNHNWTVYCRDYAQNSIFSETYNFTISRTTNLTIWDDADYYSNFSIFEDITFYANLTDSDNNSINNSNCNISFSSNEDFSMEYNSTFELYVLNHGFNVSGQIDYNVTCLNELYNDVNSSDGIYIYPKTNASVSKKISLMSNNKFNITIDFQNLANYSGYVEIVDFIHQDFNVSYTLSPSGTKNVSGKFFGQTVYWRFFLNALEKGDLSYVVEAKNDYYKYVRLYMLGFDASDVEQTS